MWAAQHCSRLFSSTLNRLCVFTRVYRFLYLIYRSVGFFIVWRTTKNRACRSLLRSGLLQLVICRLVSTCWNKLQQACWQLATDLFSQAVASHANASWYRLVATSCCKMSTDLLQLARFWLCRFVALIRTIDTATVVLSTYSSLYMNEKFLKGLSLLATWYNFVAIQVARECNLCFPIHLLL